MENLTERFQIPNQVVGFVLVTGLVSVVASVILTLLILTGINRSLNVGRHAAVRELRAEFTELDTSLDDLTAELGSIDQRLQAVEGLSGRMATLESEFELVREDVDQASSTVDQVSETVTILSQDVESMVEKVDLYDGFLEGIRALVSELFAADEVPPSP